MAVKKEHWITFIYGIVVDNHITVEKGYLKDNEVKIVFENVVDYNDIFQKVLEVLEMGNKDKEKPDF